MALVPPESSVLWFGPLDPILSRELESRSCRLFAIPIDATDSTVTIAPHLADLDRLDLGRARFDVAVVPDILGRVREPEAMLDALKIALRTGGRLIATVPNAAHPAVRRALEMSLDPYRGGSPLDTGQTRLFTRDSFCLAIEEAGFALGRLDSVDDDEGAGPAAWLAVAYPLPIAGLDVLQAQFRELARARDESDRDARQLRELLAQTRDALDSAHRRAEDLAAQDRASHAAMIDAHDALLLRDQEFRATAGELLTRLEELEPLRRERDAAHRHALAAESRCRALELRIEHVVMEFPRRLARPIKRFLHGRGSRSPSSLS